MLKIAAARRSAAGRPNYLSAIRNAQNALLRRQHPDGYWVGTLEADASVGAGYLPLLFFLTGRIPDRQAGGIVNHIFSCQLPDGSWASYYGGPGDLSVSVQTYFALKLAGSRPETPQMRAARAFIHRSGGVQAVNTITRIWLALFGQVSWDSVPTVPPELILLPGWLPVNIYEFASWSRATIVAIMAIIALRPVCPVPVSAALEDIAVNGSGGPAARLRRWGPFTWEAVFLHLDRLFKAWERLAFKPLRRTALQRVEEWILSRQEQDGGWGGILLPWVYSLIALKSLGRSAEDPAIRRGIRGLEDFFVEREGGLLLQPAVSPVWDTAWSVIALRESGLPADHPALRNAARWLLGQEIRHRGDWAVKNPRVNPGCWAFEFVNKNYPDLDDTAVVPRALLRVRLEGGEESRKQEAIRRAAAWIRAMQGRDGGWAAFDRDNDRPILAHVPYGDFMTPLDPASPDVTAHVIEFLSELGGGGQAVAEGLRFLRRRQEPNGAWFGRWGVNYLYGTGLSLAAFQVAGERMEQGYIRKAAGWLEACQNPDGGWGESCITYDDPGLRGRGASTASQTAWALLGLSSAAATEQDRLSAERPLARGVEYLLKTQDGDGEWQEREYTGTGFPRAFYLRYDLYRLYFPLLALARCGVATTALSESERAFSRVSTSERILLVSHCLRKSSGCRAEQGKWGLECRHCTESCPVHRLTQAALQRGYKGVCIAPGGSMALNYIRQTHPQGIVAIACRKELEQGIRAVNAPDASPEGRPAIVVVPLSKDGCVDTEVDVPQAMRVINLGGTANG
jgi:squalene-hopene/tetraprenyl-beta-curcumene cyclase